MIEQVFRRTAVCTLLDEVIITTCDEQIARIANGFVTKTVMTSAIHKRASDRVAKASADDPAEIGGHG
jgi:CMP-2-keto-3-deoxyoctulosonic acid synthetase